MSSLSCFVVGNGVVAVSCVEILLRQGWQVLGVYSADDSLPAWAQAQDIPIPIVNTASGLEARSTFQEQILNSEYDYLFSINNTQWILPGCVLARARVATINYHDSPLPKYAGLYATSWALLNGETQHAVTWHEVIDKIDAGRIFKQKVVPILADDTALDLNTRCFEAAVESFEALVTELAIEPIEPYDQDLAQRSYFGASHRPASAAVLSFEAGSQEIYSLVRAVEFGLTRNPLGLAKIWLPGGVIVVESARIVTTAYGIPGRVLKLDADGLCIATADGAVEFSRISTIDGKDLAVESLIDDYGIRVGSVLPTIDRDLAAAISQRNTDICHYEQVWAKRLGQVAPFRHPYLPVETARRWQTSIYRNPLVLESKKISAKSLLSMFAAYFARLSSELEFDLGLQTETQRSVAPEIFAQRVPLRVKVQSGDSFSQFQERLETALDRTTRLGSFRHTLWRRYPELRDNQIDRALPVTIVLAASPDRLDWQHLNTAMALVAYEDDSAPELVHAGALTPVDSQAIVCQLQNLIAACVDQPEQALELLPLLSATEQQQILVDWNQTAVTFPPDTCVHQLFEQQAARTPDAIAVAVGAEQLTYRELNQRANQLAHYLRLQGVGPDRLVGLYLERSLAMMVGLLAIQKAGGAYLPLDPDFPDDRLAFMLADAQAAVVLTQQELIANLSIDPNRLDISIETTWDEIAGQPITNPDSGVKPEHLSYIIYTSGSTGKPKGVMIEHRNAINFFIGMDQRIEHQQPGVWLAVTSFSFDISVLELFWTLARGFKVVIYSAKAERASTPSFQLQHQSKTVDFSLFYFSSDDRATAATEKYRLLFEGTEFADLHGFKAVWTPERHFHAFGGSFPNAAVTSAAIAARTKQIQIRAGSCVAPLHSSVRIAEDWAVIDNISGGRVGVSFAAGWQPNDFVLRPETYENRKEIMFEQIEEVRSLWRGETVAYPNGKGELVDVQTLPRPIQTELPIWVTAAGNPETFQMAGAKGFNILTHLLGQSLTELAAKIAIYRQAWSEHHHPGQGTVTLMIHTFVGQTDAEVREIVRQPMREYLASSLDLIKLAAWDFPTFKQQTTDAGGKFSVQHLSEQALDELLDFSFERYFETSGIFGTIETCAKMVDRIKGIDVNEIACLIDYGVDPELVLAQLPLLDRVKVESNPQVASQVVTPGNSVEALIDRHQVTHLQCTPSMANLLIADPSTRESIGQIRTMMVGGEALTEALAVQLKQIVSGQIHNMYGPTETTIWSTTYSLDRVDGIVPLGRPIANTQLYILDRHQQPVPVGIAGELLIGGNGVARGYLNRSELTQSRFIPNPFSTDSGDRLYRTGDLVRYRIDGNLEFLGRIDFQVKVRGYRIELGEIETILSRHEAILAATIIVREDLPGDRRLVAYLIPQPGQQPTNRNLRAYLRAQLPEYMVPSHFVWLQAFPLTPNNKVDRLAFPMPSLIQPKAKIPTPQNIQIPAIPELISSQNSTEQKLVGIWQQVLQIPEVNLDDNFFDLGGNSLVAITLIGEIRSAFDVNLPLLTLFRSPTVLDIAKEIEKFQIEQKGE